MRTWQSVEQCLQELPGLGVGERAIRCVVLHHTWRPNHAQWRGDASARAIKAFWLRRQNEEGWRNPPGAHFLIGPEGKVFAPFGDLRVPLNANSDLQANRNGIAIEAVGDFDRGRDLLQGVQRHAVLGLVGGLLVRFGLTPGDLYFHRSFPEARKTCPGSGLSLGEMRQAAGPAMMWARGVMG